MPKVESPLSDIIACCEQDYANSHGWAARRGKRRRFGRSGFAMLNVPTLWTAFVVNFLALGLIWAYITQSYPSFDEAAGFWTGSAFAAVAGAATAMLVLEVDSLLPLLAGGTIVIFSTCLGAMGVKRFYGEPTAGATLC